MEIMKLKIHGMKSKYRKLNPEDVIEKGDIQCLMDYNPANMTAEDFQSKQWHEVMSATVGDKVKEYREWRVFLRKL